MYAEERQDAILKLTQTLDRVKVAELSEHFGVSSETIRKDLDVLDEKGLIKRAHGGAVRVERVSFATPVTDRTTLNIDEKRAIGRQALSTIPEDSTVAIDAGTSTIVFAQEIPRDYHLTVVTYSLLVANHLSTYPNINVYMIGGMVRENSRATVGSWALQQAEGLVIDYSIISVDGVHENFGYTTHNLEESAIKSALLRKSKHRYVLADNTKFGKSEFAVVAGLEEVDLLFTDAKTPKAQIEKLGTFASRVRIARH